MDKFCLVAAGDKGWIVETKFVFKLGDDGAMQPITLNEDENQTCYIRKDGTQINCVNVIDSDDHPNVLKNRHDNGLMRIRTLKISQYSPEITEGKTKDASVLKKKPENKQASTAHNSGEFLRNLLPPSSPIPPDHAVHDEDGLLNNEEEETVSQSPHARSSHSPSILNSSQEREQRNLSEAKSSSASSRTRRPILRRRDNHNRNLRGAGRLQRLETRVINISNQLKRYVKSNNNQKKRRHTIEYPVLPMSIVIENDTEFTIIDGVKIKNELVAQMLLKKSMRGRANVLMHAMWPPAVMRCMYFKPPANDENVIRITSADQRKVRDICLSLQRRKEIDFLEGGPDDITINLREWISVLFRQCRLQMKKEEEQQVQ